MQRSDWLAAKALSNGDFQEAVNLFKRAMEEGQTAQRWFGLATAYENLQAWPEARWASHKALELNPTDIGIVTLQKGSILKRTATKE
jgi:Flp pilus assembly protein TadD